MRIVFTGPPVPKAGRPYGANIASEAEIHFEEGPLVGLRLSGICVRRTGHGLHVTLPARSYYDESGGKRYVDFLSALDGGEALRRFRQWVATEFEKKERER